MTTDSSATCPHHPPLAHDARGAAIPVPEGTTHWRILRGRDTHPARFGLEMTREDLLELCGPGTYRIEASDRHGDRIDLVTTLTVGEPPARPSREVLDDDRDGDADPPPSRLRSWPEPAAARADDQVRATTHVLRVRSRLTLDDQRQFDDLIRGDTASELVATLVGLTEDAATAAARQRIAREPAALDVRGSLSADEQAIVISTLRLEMSPAEADMVVRAYLAPGPGRAAT